MTVPRIDPVDPVADDDLARALLALQREGYAAEAALIGDDRIPPLHEDLAQLRREPLRWLAARDEERLLGAVAWAADSAEIVIDRLMVAASSRRRGVGGGLVRAVLRQAGGRAVTVSTGRDNLPARTLYRGLGFRETGEREVLPGLWVTDYRR